MAIKSVVVLSIFLTSACVVRNPDSAPQRASYTSQQSAPLQGQGGDTLRLSGMVEINTLACTKMGCGPDNPCCNSCSAELAMTVDQGTYQGQRMVIKGHGCTANECGVMKECSFVQGQRAEVDVATVDCTSEPGQCIAVMQNTPPIATAQANTVPGPSDGVMNTSLYGKVQANSQCTLMACPPEKACCNACNASIAIEPMNGTFEGKVIPITGHGCSADGCGRLTGCALKADTVVMLPEVGVTCDAQGACQGAVINNSSNASN